MHYSCTVDKTLIVSYSFWTLWLFTRLLRIAMLTLALGSWAALLLWTYDTAPGHFTPLQISNILASDCTRSTTTSFRCNIIKVWEKSTIDRFWASRGKWALHCNISMQSRKHGKRRIKNVFDNKGEDIKWGDLKVLRRDRLYFDRFEAPPKFTKEVVWGEVAEGWRSHHQSCREKRMTAVGRRLRSPQVLVGCILLISFKTFFDLQVCEVSHRQRIPESRQNVNAL